MVGTPEEDSTMFRILQLALTLPVWLVPSTALAIGSPAPVVHPDNQPTDCCLVPVGGGTFLCPFEAIVVDSGINIKLTEDADGGVHLTCRGSVPANERPGKRSGADVQDGVSNGTQCSVFTNDYVGRTDRWHQVITPSGKFSLVCHFDASDLEF
jgi:hypothetical protein